MIEGRKANLDQRPLEAEGRARPRTGFESAGNVLRRLRLDRRSLERRMGKRFDLELSRDLDQAILAEEALTQVLRTGSDAP